MVDTPYISRVFTPAGDFTSGIEGPAVDRDGNLYAVNFERQHTIGRITPSGAASLFLDLPEGSTGNGIRFDSAHRMLIADYTGHNILRVEMQTEQIEVFAHEPTFHQPNDICIADNDILFASDPDWKGSMGQIWRIDTDGAVTLLESDMGTTNGIEVGPDERTLYVNESVQRNVWAYSLTATGEISDKRLLIQFPDFGMDGMRCDVDGNLYITRHGKGTIAKVSPAGEVLLEIQLKGKMCTNLAFGGTDGCSCYVTLADEGNIELFRTERPGRAWSIQSSSSAPSISVI